MYYGVDAFAVIIAIVATIRAVFAVNGARAAQYRVLSADPLVWVSRPDDPV